MNEEISRRWENDKSCKGNPWEEEIVAELLAAVLCQMVGKTSKHLGNNFRYIKHCAEKDNLSPVKACLEMLNDVETILDLILAVREKGDREIPVTNKIATLSSVFNLRKNTERGDTDVLQFKQRRNG